MKTSIILVCISLLFGSCKGYKFQKEVERFSKSEVIIPSSIPQIYLGRDTVAIDLTRTMASLVIFTDSTACASCQIDHMYEYDEMIDFRSETGEKYSPIFIFSPRTGHAKDVKYTLSITRFRYPILLDESGEFLRQNSTIPSDKRLHAFLLDKNGKVLLIGDPSHNPKLWELYKKTIRGLISNNGTLPE